MDIYLSNYSDTAIAVSFFSIGVVFMMFIIAKFFKPRRDIAPHRTYIETINPLGPLAETARVSNTGIIRTEFTRNIETLLGVPYPIVLNGEIIAYMNRFIGFSDNLCEFEIMVPFDSETKYANLEKLQKGRLVVTLIPRISYIEDKDFGIEQLVTGARGFTVAPSK